MASHVHVEMRNHLSNLQTFFVFYIEHPFPRETCLKHSEKNTYTKVALKKSCDIQESLLILFVQPQIQGLGIPKNPCLLHAFHTHIQHSTGRTPRSKLESPHLSWDIGRPTLLMSKAVFFASTMTMCVNTQ